MSNPEHSRTIFDYVIEKLVDIESKFSALSNYATHEDHTGLCYNKTTHRFAPQSENKVYSHHIELKSALEDLTDHTKIILAHIHPLLKELNNAESAKVILEIRHLISIIDHTHLHISAYIQSTNLPGALKSGMLYLAELLKNTIRECQILNIEIYNDETEHNMQDYLNGSSPPAAPSKEITAEKIGESPLKAITEDVDQILQRLPFSTSEMERKRIIEERFEHYLQKLNPQAPPGIKLASEGAHDHEDEWE